MLAVLAVLCSFHFHLWYYFLSAEVEEIILLASLCYPSVIHISQLRGMMILQSTDKSRQHQSIPGSMSLSRIAKRTSSIHACSSLKPSLSYGSQLKIQTGYHQPDPEKSRGRTPNKQHVPVRSTSLRSTRSPSTLASRNGHAFEPRRRPRITIFTDTFRQPVDDGSWKSRRKPDDWKSHITPKVERVKRATSEEYHSDEWEDDLISGIDDTPVETISPVAQIEAAGMEQLQMASVMTKTEYIANEWINIRASLYTDIEEHTIQASKKNDPSPATEAAFKSWKHSSSNFFPPHLRHCSQDVIVRIVSKNRGKPQKIRDSGWSFSWETPLAR